MNTVLTNTMFLNVFKVPFDSLRVLLSHITYLHQLLPNNSPSVPRCRQDRQHDNGFEVLSKDQLPQNWHCKTNKNIRVQQPKLYVNIVLQTQEYSPTLLV